MLTWPVIAVQVVIRFCFAGGNMVSHYTNLAFNRYAEQSGVFGVVTPDPKVISAEAKKAVDKWPGYIDHVTMGYNGLTCSYTAWMVRPWWRVNIGGGKGREMNMRVQYVQITNVHFGGNHLRNFEVSVIRSDSAVRHRCYHFVGEFPSGESRLLQCQRLVPPARTVEIQLKGEEHATLALCDVAVFYKDPGYVEPKVAVKSDVDVDYAGVECGMLGNVCFLSKNGLFSECLIEDKSNANPNAISFVPSLCTIPRYHDNDFEYILGWSTWTHCRCGRSCIERSYRTCKENTYKGTTCPTLFLVRSRVVQRLPCHSKHPMAATALLAIDGFAIHPAKVLTIGANVSLECTITTRDWRDNYDSVEIQKRQEDSWMFNPLNEMSSIAEPFASSGRFTIVYSIFNIPPGSPISKIVVKISIKDVTFSDYGVYRCIHRRVVRLMGRLPVLYSSEKILQAPPIAPPVVANVLDIPGYTPGQESVPLHLKRDCAAPIWFTALVVQILLTTVLATFICSCCIYSEMNRHQYLDSFNEDEDTETARKPKSGTFVQLVTDWVTTKTLKRPDWLDKIPYVSVTERQLRVKTSSDSSGADNKNINCAMGETESVELSGRGHYWKNVSRAANCPTSRVHEKSGLNISLRKQQSGCNVRDVLDRLKMNDKVTKDDLTVRTQRKRNTPRHISSCELNP